MQICVSSDLFLIIMYFTKSAGKINTNYRIQHYFSAAYLPHGVTEIALFCESCESTLTSYVTQMYWLCFQNVVLVLQVLLPFFKKDRLAVHRSEVSNTCIFKYVPVYYFLIIIFFCKAVHNCTWSHPAIKDDDRLGINVSTAKIISVHLNTATQTVIILQNGSVV